MKLLQFVLKLQLKPQCSLRAVQGDAFVPRQNRIPVRYSILRPSGPEAIQHPNQLLSLQLSSSLHRPRTPWSTGLDFLAMSSQPIVEPRQTSHDLFHLTIKWSIHGDLSESVALTGRMGGPPRLYTNPKRVTLRLTSPKAAKINSFLQGHFFDL